MVAPISISDFQRYLKEAGYYKGKIDGKLGRQTQEAWDRWYCDMCAIEEYER